MMATRGPSFPALVWGGGRSCLIRKVAGAVTVHNPSKCSGIPGKSNIWADTHYSSDGVNGFVTWHKGEELAWNLGLSGTEGEKKRGFGRCRSHTEAKIVSFSLFTLMFCNYCYFIIAALTKIKYRRGITLKLGRLFHAYPVPVSSQSAFCLLAFC